MPHHPMGPRHKRWVLAWSLAFLSGGAWSQNGDDTISATRQQALVHIVRQDCGSCHGMTLRGGLGPALTPAALSDRSVDTLVAIVLHGRPGTPMPGWQAMINEQEARWIAQQLLRGFPQERQP
jgi:cytochrome c55X